MNNLIRILLLIQFGFASVVVFAQGKNDIRIQSQIFRIFDNIEGDYSVDEKVWTTDEPPEEARNIVTLFDEGEFLIDGHKLILNSKGLFLNGEKITINNSSNINLPKNIISIIASPEINMKNETEFSLQVNAKQPVQYFVKKEENLYELKETVLPTGLDINVWAEVEDDNKILLTDLVLSMNYISKRKRLEGTNLQVGFPVMDNEKYTFYFRVKSGKDYGILIKPSHSQGLLLIRLRATRI